MQKSAATDPKAPQPAASATGEHPGAALPSGEGSALSHGPAGDGANVAPAAERDLWVGRTHWKHYAGRLLLWFVACVAASVGVGVLASRVDWLTGNAAFWIIVGLIVVVGAVGAGPVLLRVIDHRYRLTTQRLFIERGILSRTIDQTELIRIDDVRVSKTLIDRIFGLGTVAVVSTDVSDREMSIVGIAGADEVAEMVRTHMRALRQKSLFVESL